MGRTCRDSFCYWDFHPAGDPGYPRDMSFSLWRRCLHLTKGLNGSQRWLTSFRTPGFRIFSEIIGENKKKKQKPREKSAWLLFFFWPEACPRKKKQPFSPSAPAILLSPQLASHWGLLPGSWAPGKHSLYVCSTAWMQYRYLSALARTKQELQPTEV